MLLPKLERFWRKVDKRGPDECWPWTGSKIGKNRDYGTMRISGRNVRATHISWSLANAAPFPAGHLACHTCDNPACVNPNHIWPGTPQQNSRDMVAKDRHAGRCRPIGHPKGVSA